MAEERTPRQGFCDLPEFYLRDTSAVAPQNNRVACIHCGEQGEQRRDGVCHSCQQDGLLGRSALLASRAHNFKMTLFASGIAATFACVMLLL